MIVTPPGDEHAYEMIEAAVMETARGRWFLSEYARRNRHAETETILGAIDKLQRSLAAPPVIVAPMMASGPAHNHVQNDHLQNEIVEMARVIAATEREIRAIRPDGVEDTQFVSASDELDAVVATTEKAASTILSAAERVQEYAWTMREQNGNVGDCDMLDNCATEIYTACGFQDLTAQRIRKVVETLRFIDTRLKSLLETTGQAEDFHADEKMIAEMAEPAPIRPSANIWMCEPTQADVDDTFDFFEPAAAPMAEPTMIDAEAMAFDLPPEMPAKAPAAPESLPPAKNPATKAGRKTRPEATQSPASPGASSSPASSSPASSSPYDGLSTEEKLRAFR